ncbi:hypothetical protein POM88_014185 [Heracleum sosnowskyi]|uniref:Uncharacterized protein n=1 Tax=Heracleum sosnowskyi TaxID=360622 RepID=A0AAD8J1H5_9APIA|nr:hypothetical protein POM88_014185 [Heracleum sosnowskyi]
MVVEMLCGQIKYVEYNFISKIWKEVLLQFGEFVSRMNLGDSEKRCKWCNFFEESIEHIMWRCELARWGWCFLARWWSLGSNFLNIRNFSVEYLMSLHGGGIISHIWRMVVAEGAASNLVPFVDDPIWKVNPQGIIKIHYTKVNNDFWKFKRINFSFVSVVDGAWVQNDYGVLVGGIGGNIKDKSRAIIYAFYVPVNARDSLAAEFEAIKHVILISSSRIFEGGKILICSDSSQAISSVKSGIFDGLQVVIRNKDIKEWVDGKIKMGYVPKYLNEEANSLAKYGLKRQASASYWAQ